MFSTFRMVFPVSERNTLMIHITSEYSKTCLGSFWLCILVSFLRSARILGVHRLLCRLKARAGYVCCGAGILQRDSWDPCGELLPLQPISAELGVNRLNLVARAANGNRVCDQLALGRSGTCTNACLGVAQGEEVCHAVRTSAATLNQRENQLDPSKWGWKSDSSDCSGVAVGNRRLSVDEWEGLFVPRQHYCKAGEVRPGILISCFIVMQCLMWCLLFYWRSATDLSAPVLFI